MASDLARFSERLAVSLVWCLVALQTAFGTQDSTAKRPNMILVMADDLGWGDVAYNGNNIVLTPHLDT